ncbi:hypothetical protein TPHA_0C04310 [Tetrapisispora phaffii CBS 4417]|uniref:Telomere replication protein EST3 n=1 Tax=Tetrapisispora phaffii (strain ATCC 24235 / CBS 4417 / NBRC 1672 / NRRL Y-8282 / UCD 70-5) TaxID=1071381 RepID=G8BQR9_TETPH|nr:LOW QUALITY PROTEIN: hypothetical protein TPHA_0C04310 [Tetrapisispora phaffii CBS 4417]CCE62581.1 hypothetical protein TPHA_0C04310 [Tetrapisispora phaffii CBS 4417]
MPKIILPSKVNLSPDSIFLKPWIKEFIEDGKKNSIGKIGNLDELLNNTNVKLQLILKYPNQLVKLTNIYNILNYCVFGSIRDNKHQLLVEFTSNCVSNFERNYKIRITDQTKNCLFLIGDCIIKYVTHDELLKNFKIDPLQFDNHIGITEYFDFKKYGYILSERRFNRLYPILQVNQVMIFDWDQVVTFENYPFVYSQIPY